VVRARSELPGRCCCSAQGVSLASDSTVPPLPPPRWSFRPLDCLYGRRLGERDGREEIKLAGLLVALAGSELLVVCCWVHEIKLAGLLVALAGSELLVVCCWVHVAGFVLLGSPLLACWSLRGGACRFPPCPDSVGRARRCLAVPGRAGRAERALLRALRGLSGLRAVGGVGGTARPGRVRLAGRAGRSCRVGSAQRLTAL